MQGRNLYRVRAYTLAFVTYLCIMFDSILFVSIAFLELLHHSVYSYDNGKLTPEFVFFFVSAA